MMLQCQVHAIAIAPLKSKWHFTNQHSDMQVIFCRIWIGVTDKKQENKYDISSQMSELW